MQGKEEVRDVEKEGRGMIGDIMEVLGKEKGRKFRKGTGKR